MLSLNSSSDRMFAQSLLLHHFLYSWFFFKFLFYFLFPASLIALNLICTSTTRRYGIWKCLHVLLYKNVFSLEVFRFPALFYVYSFVFLFLNHLSIHHYQIVLPAKHLVSLISFTKYIFLSLRHHDPLLAYKLAQSQYQPVLHLSSQISIVHYNIPPLLHNIISQHYYNIFFSINSICIEHCLIFWHHFVFSRVPQFTQTYHTQFTPISNIRFSSFLGCHNILTFHVPMLKFISLLMVLLKQFSSGDPNLGLVLPPENIYLGKNHHS